MCRGAPVSTPKVAYAAASDHPGLGYTYSGYTYYDHPGLGFTYYGYTYYDCPGLGYTYSGYTYYDCPGLGWLLSTFCLGLEWKVTE